MRYHKVNKENVSGPLSVAEDISLLVSHLSLSIYLNQLNKMKNNKSEIYNLQCIWCLVPTA